MQSSLPDLVCLFLEGRGSLEPPVSRAVTIPGIDEGLAVSDGVADRVTLLSELEAMAEEGLVRTAVRPVAGTDHERRAFALTPAGRRRAERLRADLAADEEEGEAAATGLPPAARDDPAIAALVREGPHAVGGSGDLVGRGAVLERLADALADARTAGGRTVAVTGRTGIGKTALAAAFRDAATAEGATVASAACRREASAPYRVFRRAFASLSALPPLASVLESTPVPRRGGPDVVAARRQALYDDVADALRDVAAEGPLVVVIENAHWADEASQALLAYLQETLTEWVYPVVLVATARPAAVGEGPLASLLAAVEAADRHEHVALDPLTREETGALLRRTLPGGSVSDAVVRTVHEETGGVPLLVEEAARRLRGADDPTAPPADVPSSVEAAVEGRLAALDETGRDVASLAAVLGEEFRAADLAAASDVSAPRLRDYLDALVGSDVLERVDGDADRLRFRQAAARERLLADLDAATLERYHGLAATVLRERAGGDAAGRIARHYRAAGRPSLALSFSRRAGDRAVELYAHDLAVERYRTALAVADEADARPARAAAVAADLADVYRLLGNYDAARGLLEEYRGTSGVTALEERMTAIAGRIATAVGRYDRALELAAEGLEGGGDAPSRSRCHLLDVRATARVQQAAYDEARETARRQREVAAALDAPALVAAAESHLGRIAFQEADYDRARAHSETMLEHSRRGDDEYRTALARKRLGNVSLFQKEFEDAREQYEAALELFETVGDRHEAAKVTNNLGLVAMETGDLETARERLREALSAFEDLGDGHAAAKAHNHLGVVLRRLEDAVAATDHYREALARAARIGDPHLRARARANLASAAIDREEYDRARSFAARAREELADLGDRRGVTLAERDLARIDVAAGDYDGALHRFEDVVERLREAGDLAAVVETAVLVVGVAAERDDAETASEWSERGLAALERIDDPVPTIAAYRETFREHVAAAGGDGEPPIDNG